MFNKYYLLQIYIGDDLMFDYSTSGSSDNVCASNSTITHSTIYSMKFLTNLGVA